ncbi:MAG: hypothetical protein IJP38_03760 [Oscillospiraceae bacterium]|nr:hypothetical protein [Oscillospiraceae bacterium]
MNKPPKKRAKYHYIIAPLRFDTLLYEVNFNVQPEPAEQEQPEPAEQPEQSEQSAEQKQPESAEQVQPESAEQLSRHENGCFRKGSSRFCLTNRLFGNTLIL